MSDEWIDELIEFFEKNGVSCKHGHEIFRWAGITTVNSWKECMRTHNTWDAMNKFLKETVFANDTAWRTDEGRHWNLLNTVRTLSRPTLELT